jgi:phosphonate transport system substrate-binding protein
MQAHLRISLVALALVAAMACSSKTEKPSEDQPAEQANPTPEQIAPVAKKKIRVTGIPDENPTELQRKYAPMVAYLEKTLDAEVEYIPVTDYGAAVQALSADKMDFAWLGGFTHVQARILADAVPLCMRDIDREFKTVFIASKKSGIKTPADLKGKTFAFGSKSSTSGHLMPRHFLTTEFSIDAASDFKGDPVFSGAHDATAKMVESGKVAAGALNAEVWERLIAEKKVDTKKVSVIWTTPGYVDYVWTARNGVEPATQAAFAKAFLDLDASNPEHRVILDLQGAKEKFVPATSADFDAIESVGRSTGLIQ